MGDFNNDARDDIVVGNVIGNSTVFTGSITSGTDTMYTWDLGDGTFYLSASPNRLEPIVVDDELVMMSGNTTHFVYQFSQKNNPEPALVEIPANVMASMAGQTVTVIYQDVFGVLVSASEVWLIWVP